MRHMIYLWILLGFFGLGLLMSFLMLLGACTFQQVAHPPFSQLDLP
jgi:hypothetical protein